MDDIVKDKVDDITRPKYVPYMVYSRTLTQVIAEYQNVCLQLNEIADETPESAECVNSLIARERDLFDQHSALLNEAMKMKVKSFADAKAILALWKNEVVGDQEIKSLSAGDKIVLSVSKFLEGY
ncbi:hypothetical protein DES40_1472 [Litorimonas taeanensis]|uniref:Uncharacterized protein n=1 Tax=Litorimonas taeanensis TaxID=568099 RepID=A0A420WML7_9PROT|nr:hypothetical protein [Litorimonas taeanensis]RKQ72135.1 hypothetical protein DES40_1472 [Litorimonas taeanensis]